MLSVAYAECHKKPFMLSIVMLKVVILSVVMLSSVKLSVMAPNKLVLDQMTLGKETFRPLQQQLGFMIENIEH
jgi:hypothetical protein